MVGAKCLSPVKVYTRNRNKATQLETHVCPFIFECLTLEGKGEGRIMGETFYKYNYHETHYRTNYVPVVPLTYL
jgi:hypothetical protein